MKTTVSTKGQATIPNHIREKHGIEAGTQLEWGEILEIGAIIVFPISKKRESLTDLIKRANKLAKGADLMGNYLKEKREEINREKEKFSNL